MVFFLKEKASKVHTKCNKKIEERKFVLALALALLFDFI